MLVTVPLGPRFVQVGLEEAGELVEQVELLQQPGLAREGEGLRRVAQADDERRAASRLRRLRAGGERQVGGFRPTGSAVIAKRDAQLCARRASARRRRRCSERPQAVLAACGERWAERARFGSKATRAPASAGRPAKRLSKVARAYFADGALAARFGRLEVRRARRDDDHPVARGGGRAVGRPRRRRVGGEGQPRLARRRAPPRRGRPRARGPGRRSARHA